MNTSVQTLLAGVDRLRFVPSGVADATDGRIFVPGEFVGIDALDRATGELLWHSDAARLPLLGLNGALVAAIYDGAVKLLFLDVRDGRRMDIALTGIATPPGREWWIIDKRLDGRDLLLDWRTVLPQRAPEPSIFREGTVRVRLDDGAVTDVPNAAPALVPAVPDSEIFRDANGQPSAWRVGDQICALAVVAANQTSRLNLVCRASDRGKPKVRRLVAEMPKPGYLEHHPSPDTEHVYLLLCNDWESDGKPAGSICTWLIFSVAEGRQILTLANRSGLQPPLAIVGDRLFYIELGVIPAKRQRPLQTLHALNVSGGAPVWTHPLPQQPAERLV